VRARHGSAKEDGYQPNVSKPLDDAQRAWFDAQYVLDKEARADKAGTRESEQEGNLGRGSEEARYGFHERHNQPTQPSRGCLILSTKNLD